jgi:hypothetical protein
MYDAEKPFAVVWTLRIPYTKKRKTGRKFEEMYSVSYFADRQTALRAARKRFTNESHTHVEVQHRTSDDDRTVIFQRERGPRDTA